MWVEDVSRAEAERLGLLSPGQTVEPDPARIDQNLFASVDGWTDEEKERLKGQFGDQVQILGNRAVWQGTMIKDFVGEVLSGGPRRTALRLGAATPRAADAASSHGDISGKQLLLEVGHVHKTWRDHGPESPDRNPISRLDYELIPHVWREPDRVGKGEEGRWCSRRQY